MGLSRPKFINEKEFKLNSCNLIKIDFSRSTGAKKREMKALEEETILKEVVSSEEEGEIRKKKKIVKKEIEKRIFECDICGKRYSIREVHLVCI